MSTPEVPIRTPTVAAAGEVMSTLASPVSKPLLPTLARPAGLPRLYVRAAALQHRSTTAFASLLDASLSLLVVTAGYTTRSISAARAGDQMAQVSRPRVSACTGTRASCHV